MESDIHLLRIYVSHFKSIIFTITADFKQCNEERLPGFSTLLDGLARQSELEAETQDKDSTAEEQLLKSFSAVQLEYR